MGALITKDIVFAMFSLGLSIFVGRELFKSVVYFFIELAHGIQVFSQREDASLAVDADGPITKEDIRRINESDEIRNESMHRIKKSITCNGAISISLLFIGFCALALNSAQIQSVNDFDVIWLLILSLMFVYGSSYIWNRFKTKQHWEERGTMSYSRYELLIYLGSTLLLLYLAHINLFPGRTYWFLGIASLWIFVSTRLFRIPHVHKTDQRPESYHISAELYLKDSVREPIVYVVVFLSAYWFHHAFNTPIEQSALGAWLQDNALWVALVIALIPFAIFLWVFARTVKLGNIFRFLFQFRSA